MSIDYYEECLPSSISLEDLIGDIKQGREIEFSFQGQSYFIDNSRERRTVWIRKKP